MAYIASLHQEVMKVHRDELRTVLPVTVMCVNFQFIKMFNGLLEMKMNV